MGKGTSLAALVALTTACSSGSGGGNPGGSGGGTSVFEVSGTTGSDGVVAVAWQVSSGSPDYTYSFGSGTAQGSSFTVSFGSTPPAEALNSYGTGVAVVVVLEPGTSVPQGKVDFKSLEPSILGVSASHAIIYKAPDASAPDWVDTFPTGYACGECVPAASGFDSFSVTDCSSLLIVPFSNASFCNWT